jgi:hypothetical protein
MPVPVPPLSKPVQRVRTINGYGKAFTLTVNTSTQGLQTDRFVQRLVLNGN